jgi:phospholipid-transporting ATPase
LGLEFEYERPNPFIYSFTGSHRGIPLDNNNIVLRGCSIKITKWVTGVVIYTGVDSKIMLNSNKSRQKKSRLEFKMGLIVVGIFFFQMVLTFVSALISAETTLSVFLEYKKFTSYTRDLFVQWGSWILLFTNFVPISLIVTLEMVKYLQGINISNCYYLTSAPAEVKVQTSTLNEELGQI